MGVAHGSVGAAGSDSRWLVHWLAVPFAMAVAARPRSSNKPRDPLYERRLRAAAATAGAERVDGALYVRIAWFQLRPFQGDVDNIAKHIVDALKGVVFEDDDAVVQCFSQKAVSTGDGAFELDVSGIPSDAVLQSLLDLLGDEEHVLYVEVGPIVDNTVRFGPLG